MMSNAMRSTAMLAVLVLAASTVTASAASKSADGPAPKKTPTVKTENDDASELSGKVVETMNAGGYTYVCLEKAGKKTWVAVPEMKVTVGAKMVFQPGQSMTNFTSKSLNRTFDRVVFSGGVEASDTMPPGHPGVPMGGPEPQGSKAQTAQQDKSISVEKAKGANAYTVSDVYGKRSSLDRKKVVVRGKVVKFSEGIMGRNWVHLQDGTGDQKKGTHNLVATTTDRVSVGDTVTVTGKLAKDRDFGAGYLYKAIVEDAKIEK